MLKVHSFSAVIDFVNYLSGEKICGMVGFRGFASAVGLLLCQSEISSMSALDSGWTDFCLAL